MSHWTKKERRDYLFEKYYRRRDKIFTIVAIFIFVVILLWILYSGWNLFTPVREISVSILFLFVLLFFHFAMQEEFPHFKILAIITLVLLIILSLVAWDIVTGLTQLVLLAVMIIVFIALIFIAVFVTDLIVYENS